MAAKKKPSAAQLAARAKFVAMVRAKSKAKKSATKKATVKKASPKKAAKKKVATKKAATHKDTKSHNVRINVVSGIDDILKDYLKTKELLIKIEKAIRNTPILAEKYGYTKPQTKIALDKLKKYKKETSLHLTQLKKLL